MLPVDVGHVLSVHRYLEEQDTNVKVGRIEKEISLDVCVYSTFRLKHLQVGSVVLYKPCSSDPRMLSLVPIPEGDIYESHLGKSLFFGRTEIIIGVPKESILHFPDWD